MTLALVTITISGPSHASLTEIANLVALALRPHVKVGSFPAPFVRTPEQLSLSAPLTATDTVVIQVVEEI